jgi:hypothetical protein
MASTAYKIALCVFAGCAKGVLVDEPRAVSPMWMPIRKGSGLEYRCTVNGALYPQEIRPCIFHCAAWLRGRWFIAARREAVPRSHWRRPKPSGVHVAIADSPQFPYFRKLD